MKEFWAQSSVAVADCFGVSCGTRSWLADEVKLEALNVEEGVELSTILYERNAPFWYWDVSRITMGLGRKNIYTVKTISRICHNATIL